VGAYELAAAEAAAGEPRLSPGEAAAAGA
jgi:hypothetical protein